jgi:ABC-type branched-subunit amino acid transport system substrate-binding protein
VQGIVLAKQVMLAGRENLCIVYREDAYGEGLSTALRENLDPSIHPAMVSFDPTAGSLSNVMEGCETVRLAPNPGVAFITFEGDGRTLMDDAAERGWSATAQRIFMVDGNKGQELVDALAHPEAFEGVIGTAPSGPDPATPAGERRRAFQTRFMEKFDRAVAGESENHYDAVYLAAAAIEIARSADNEEGIRVAMASTAAGSEGKVGDWVGIAAAIAADGQVNLAGASGNIDLDPATGELLPPYYVSLWTISGGQIENGDVITVP